MTKRKRKKPAPQRCATCWEEAVHKAEGCYTRLLLTKIRNTLPGLKVCAQHAVEGSHDEA